MSAGHPHTQTVFAPAPAHHGWTWGQAVASPLGSLRTQNSGVFPQGHPRGHRRLFGLMLSGLCSGTEEEIRRQGIVCVYEIVLLFFSILPRSAPAWTWNFWPHASSEFSRANVLNFLIWSLNLAPFYFYQSPLFRLLYVSQSVWHHSFCEGIPLLSPSWGLIGFILFLISIGSQEG